MQSGTRWSVAECGWKQLRPDLSDDVIDLLAAPVVVSAQPPWRIRVPDPTVPLIAPGLSRARRARHRL